ncbi:MAG: hypothetical protein VCB25_11235 [Myxococcota bacterium]
MTVLAGKTTFKFVLAKDPKRRSSRSGFKALPDTRQKSRQSRNVQKQRKDAQPFVLYVEGARDREILRAWARRVDTALMRCIEKNTVILGGRRPARAIADFRKRGGQAAGYAGLVVLDRDDHPGPNAGQTLRDEGLFGEAKTSGPLAFASDLMTTEAGLEIFVWSLRHIESYLLVPEAIRRMLRLGADDQRVERLIGANAASARSAVEDTPHATPHAKRILGPGGALSEALGTELHAGEIARAMRSEEFHADVRTLFDRIGTLSGLSAKAPEVVIRA